MTYSYDPAVANGKGELGSVGNGYSTTNYTGFDGLGNVLASNQVTASQTYAFTYAYNLAGSLVSETYPSGRTVTTTYDGANRTTAVSGVWQGQTKPYAYSAAYWPHGGLYYYGAGNNLVPVWNYNSRLQPGCEAATISNNPSAYVFIECPYWGAANNNGTLQSATSLFCTGRFSLCLRDPNGVA